MKKKGSGLVLQSRGSFIHGRKTTDFSVCVSGNSLRAYSCDACTMLFTTLSVCRFNSAEWTTFPALPKPTALRFKTFCEAGPLTPFSHYTGFSLASVCFFPSSRAKSSNFASLILSQPKFTLPWVPSCSGWLA
ncbi:hypothetical protein TGFOU_406550 [Toxoplasma gondii FOU]|uniref:Uncharacterized protein n=1 Tax=Toxoplasma gondii FOU TaxID=943167 RepID=A0A086JHQ6_TOXGO|nr:hypothetical protein TGFOU_406550 [Toxoplasma gondii FOU]